MTGVPRERPGTAGIIACRDQPGTISELRAPSRPAAHLYPYEPCHGRAKRAVGPAPGTLPGIPARARPPAVQPAAPGKVRPLRPGAADAAEGPPKPRAIPRPDRGRVHRLATPDPGQQPGRGDPSLRHRGPR